jgi:hypothetical protein
MKVCDGYVGVINQHLILNALIMQYTAVISIILIFNARTRDNHILVINCTH